MVRIKSKYERACTSCEENISASQHSAEDGGLLFT